MGSGSSRKKRSVELDRLSAGLQEESQRLQEQVSLQEDRTRRSLSSLRSELAAQDREHALELQRHREELKEEHAEAISAALKEREVVLNGHLERLSSTQREELASEHREALKNCVTKGEAEIAQHRQEAEFAKAEAKTLHGQVGPLRSEYDEAVRQLRVVRQQLQDEEQRAAEINKHGFRGLEARLTAAREDHLKTQEIHAEMERHLRMQMADLQNQLTAQTEELKKRTFAVQQRDHELLELNTELSDLQGLFDNVNTQLQNECSRVERLQVTVQACAKQGKELETLQGMLEDSHRMLAQVRDALEHERAERVKAADLLMHEQQRTRLLLDVLRHFKEKLQGLTPQMLLSRLGCADPQAFINSGGMFELGSNGSIGFDQLPTAGVPLSPSTSQQHFYNSPRSFVIQAPSDAVDAWASGLPQPGGSASNSRSSVAAFPPYGSTGSAVYGAATQLFAGGA